MFTKKQKLVCCSAARSTLSARLCCTEAWLFVTEGPSHISRTASRGSSGRTPYFQQYTCIRVDAGDDAHRDTVYKHCLDREDEDTLHDVKATDVAFANLTRELWNGRLYKQLPEHWNDRHVHTRDDFLNDADGWVDQLQRPQPWRSGSWNGALRPTRFFGLMMELHNLLDPECRQGGCADPFGPPDPRATIQSFSRGLARIMEEASEGLQVMRLIYSRATSSFQNLHETTARRFVNTRTGFHTNDGSSADVVPSCGSGRRFSALSNMR